MMCTAVMYAAIISFAIICTAIMCATIISAAIMCHHREGGKYLGSWLGKTHVPLGTNNTEREGTTAIVRK